MTDSEIVTLFIGVIIGISIVGLVVVALLFNDDPYDDDDIIN